MLFIGIKNDAGFLDKRAVKAALQQARIVFTTCAGAGSQPVVLQQYAFVVVDEASQVGMCMSFHTCHAMSCKHESFQVNIVI